MVNGPSFMTIFFYFVLDSFVWLYDMGSGMTWGYDNKKKKSFENIVHVSELVTDLISD